MAKYLVETYYNCTFKVSHYLDEVNNNELKNLEKRDDGTYEIIDVKLDNRKTKNLEKVNKTLKTSGNESENIDLISEINSTLLESLLLISVIFFDLSKFFVFLLSSLTSKISNLPSSCFSRFLRVF